MDGPVYLDYNATTPVDPRVVDAMVPYLHERFGNASSTHHYGYEAHAAVDRARQQVARLISARPGEVVFTGGGSESDNLAIKGVVFRHLDRRPHVVSVTTEHPAVINTLRYLRERFGADFDLAPVDAYGMVDPEVVRRALRPETVLVTVMHANNEVGTINPIREIAAITTEAGVLLHVDAAQSVGKSPVAVDDLGADLLTIAGHKLYAPKGIGALYIRSGTRLDPLVHGSGQEAGMRAGTENVASVVALGMAAELAAAALPEEQVRLAGLRDMLHQLLAASIPGLLMNGHAQLRLPNTLNVSFPAVLSPTMLAYSEDVAASTGAACHSADPEPSSVLLAMGLSREQAQGAVRLSLGRWSTAEEMEQAARSLSAGYEAAREVAGNPV